MTEPAAEAAKVQATAADLSAAVQRRLNVTSYTLTSDKSAVVFDIGAEYTKVGFAEESSPRAIIQTRVDGDKIFDLAGTALHEALIKLLWRCYSTYLLVTPKEKRVVVVEPLFLPTSAKKVLADVFFKHFEVPSLLLAPAHLFCLLALGIPSGLVVDCGSAETTVLPVYEAQPVVRAWQAKPIAGAAITSEIFTELSQKYSDLTREQAEDIKVCCCVVTPRDCERTLPDLNYPISVTSSVDVPGTLRRSATEVLFEGDEEGHTLATLILDALLLCPLDCRTTLASNIVVVGGTAMLPGFLARLRAELYYHAAETPRFNSRFRSSEAQTEESGDAPDSEEAAVPPPPQFRFRASPSPRNCLAWTGASLFGALESVVSRSVSRERYLETGSLMDWLLQPVSNADTGGAEPEEVSVA